MKRWAEIFKDRGLDQSRVEELPRPRGKHSLKEFRRACNMEFGFQQLEFTEDWMATI